MNPERLGRKVVYESDWVNLYLDRVRFPSGHIIEDYHMVDYPRPAVSVLVENERGELLFVRVNRYTTGMVEWELPAGGMEVGETPLEAARREAAEETGHDTVEHRLIHSYHPMPGSSNKLFHVIHCLAGEDLQSYDVNEVDEVHWFSRGEVEQMLDAGELRDGLTLVALLFWLRGACAGSQAA